MRTRALSVLSFSVVAATLVALIATPAHAGAAGTAANSAARSSPPPARAVCAITNGLARQLAGALADPTTRARIASAVSTGPVDLATIEAGSTLSAAIRAANQAVLDAKGLPVTSGSLLRLRLGHPDMRSAFNRGEIPVVAATPTDDNATVLTGYDPSGTPVVLDGAYVPSRPVLLVEVDVARALPQGLRVMRTTLAAAGIGGPAPTAAATATGGYWATKINAIRLSDDKEPWFKGAAEIFSTVGGFGLDGTAKIDIVDMPYLDYDNTTYYPNQLLVHFNGYKYNLADVVMMEDDGDTNYLALAQAIAAALLYIVDGGAYTPLVSAILAAMPNSWWTDDPDYVDSWYTLSTTSSGRLYGAAANGWMDVVPYFVELL